MKENLNDLEHNKSIGGMSLSTLTSGLSGFSNIEAFRPHNNNSELKNHMIYEHNEETDSGHGGNNNE